MAAPADGKPHSAVLGSAVYNEAEAIFRLLEHKERKCVSHLDTVTLMRGMGMNPVQAEIEALQVAMAPLVAELDELRLEEERKKEALRKKEEAKAGKDKDSKKPDPKKADPKKPGGKDAGKDGAKPGDQKEGEAKEGEEPKKKVLTEPAEEVKNIDWHIFITSVEPMYKDNREERNDIVKALKCFDTDGSNKITIEKLLEIVTTNGESVLSPAERKQFLEAFPMQSIDFEEFAHRIQGTYQPPPPPTAEELAKIAEEERQRLEAAKKAAQANDLDALLGGDPLVGAVPSDAAPAA